MLPARFNPVGRVLFLTKSSISITISIIGWIKEKLVRLRAATAFSPKSPKAFGSLHKITINTPFLPSGLPAAIDSGLADGINTTARIISAKNRVIVEG